MGLWCGHAVLPFPGFDLVFLFYLFGQVALALVTFFALSLLSLLFLFLFFFLPFCLDLFGLGVFVPFRRLLKQCCQGWGFSPDPRNFALVLRNSVRVWGILVLALNSLCSLFTCDFRTLHLAALVV